MDRQQVPLFKFLHSTLGYLQRKENGNFLSKDWEQGPNVSKQLEVNRLIPIQHALQKIQQLILTSGSDEVAFHPCSRLHRQRHDTKLASRIFYFYRYCVTITSQYISSRFLP